MKNMIAALLLAGTIYSAVYGFGSLTARAPGTNEAFVPLWLKTLDARMTINDQIAVTVVDQVFVNTASSKKEGIFRFSLPEGSVIVELALWINNKRQVAVSLEKTKATSTYDNSVRASVDPALLTSLGNNQYQINVYPLNAAGDSLDQRRIDFTYVTPLKSIADTSTMSFQLTTTGMSNQPPLRTSLSVTVASQDSIGKVLTPNFSAAEVVTTRNDPTSYSLLYGTENAYVNKDLTIKIIRPHFSEFRLKTATYVPGLDTVLSFDSTEMESYFTMWLTTPVPSAGTQKTREAVFVLDASYSMTGVRFTQLMASVQHALLLLSPGDRFNVVVFNTTSASFKSSLVPATPSNISQAVSFLQGVTTKGITNPQGAIKQAMASNWTAGSNRGIFFCTDGFVNWPLRTTAAMMIDTLTAANIGNAQLFSISMDSAADRTFLSLLSKNNGGALVVLTAADTQQGGLTKVLEQMMYPLLYDIKLDFGGMTSRDVYPELPAVLSMGEQVNISGRYSAQGTFPVVMSAKRDGIAVRETLSTTLPVPKINYRSIPQFWASAKVDYLLDQIKLMGNQPELIQAVIALGVKYRIATPYTSLLVLEAQPQGAPNTPVIDKILGKEIKDMRLMAGDFIVSKSIAIRYAVPTKGGVRNVSLKVYNLKGELVRVLVDHKASGGWYVVRWDGRDERGLRIGTGFYILVLDAGTERMVKPLHLVR
jgi:Ca-activated chloride channel homolog